MWETNVKINHFHMLYENVIKSTNNILFAIYVFI